MTYEEDNGGFDTWDGFGFGHAQGLNDETYTVPVYDM